MSKEQDALKLALEALEVATTPLAKDRQEVLRAQAAIREALAEPPCKTGSQCTSKCPQCEQTAQQEPVATIADLTPQKRHDFINDGWDLTDPLYTSPPASKPWVGLSTDEIYDMYNEPRSDAEMVEFARAIEAKLRERNEHTEKNA